MYLSRVYLDLENRETMRLLSSPEFLHGAVESCFAGAKERRLWRVDNLKDRCFILVVSENQPDFSALIARYGQPESSDAWQCKPYEPLLNHLEPGQTWQFRLRANPIQSVKSPEGGRGKVMAHVTTAQQKEWLLTRAQEYGFGLNPDGFEVVHTQWHRFHKKNNREVTLKTATFEGVLEVQDAALLRNSLVSGIGRAKAYGCGLITLALLKGSSLG